MEGIIFATALFQIDMTLGELEQDIRCIMDKKNHHTNLMISCAIRDNNQNESDGVMEQHDKKVLALFVHEQCGIN